MIDELARRRKAPAVTAPSGTHQADLCVTRDGMVELPVPGFGALEWTPDEAEAFARAMLEVAAMARRRPR